MKKLAYTLLVTTGLACLPLQSFAQDNQIFTENLKEAQTGNPEAQANLGVMYEFGKNVEKDDFKAVEWYTKAANQGNIKAQLNLGTMYGEGKGIPLDYQKAAEWFTKATNQNYGPAYLALAAVYIQGRGVEPNITKGKEYAKQGCIHKDQKSCEVYAELQKMQ